MFSKTNAEVHAKERILSRAVPTSPRPSPPSEGGEGGMWFEYLGSVTGTRPFVGNFDGSFVDLFHPPTKFATKFRQR